MNKKLLSVLMVLLSSFYFCKKKDKDEDHKMVALAALAIASQNNNSISACGIVSDSIQLFATQVSQTPGPSAGLVPWDPNICKPTYSVTGNSRSFAEEISFSNEAIKAFGTYAKLIAGGTYQDGTGILFSDTGTEFTTITSSWAYNTAGQLTRKTRTALKTISGGTTYLPYIGASTDNSPITGCPANPTGSAPKQVEVVEVSEYKYDSLGNMTQEDISYTCDGVQAQGPGFVQRKIYQYEGKLLKSLDIYANADFSVTTMQDGVTKVFTKLFIKDLSKNPVASVKYAYTANSITITQSANYIQKKNSSATAPYDESYSVTDKPVGSLVFTLKSENNRLLSTPTSNQDINNGSYTKLTCNVQAVTSDSLTILYPTMFQAGRRGVVFCASAGKVPSGGSLAIISNDSTTAYTDTLAARDSQTWYYLFTYDKTGRLSSAVETREYQTPYTDSSGSTSYSAKKTKTSLYWVYDDYGRIKQDNSNIYEYDSLGLKSYKSIEGSKGEFYVR